MNTKTLKRLLAAVLVGGMVLWIGYGVAKEAGHYDWSALRPAPLPILGAAAVLLFLYPFRAALWVLLLRSMGERLDLVPGTRVFMGAQLGRYLPGKLWQIAGASILSRRYGVSAGAAAVSTLVAVLIHHIVGGLLALLGFGRLFPNPWLLGGLIGVGGVVGVGFLVSPLLRRSLAWVGRKTKRPQLGEVQPPRPLMLLKVAPGYVLVWLGFALAMGLLSRGLFPESPAIPPVQAVGAIAAGAVAGFLVLVAPSGIGVREAAIVTLLQPILGTLQASLLAIALRILMTVIEIGYAIWGAWPEIRRKREEIDEENSGG